MPEARVWINLGPSNVKFPLTHSLLTCLLSPVLSEWKLKFLTFQAPNESAWEGPLEKLELACTVSQKNKSLSLYIKVIGNMQLGSDKHKS